RFDDAGLTLMGNQTKDAKYSFNYHGSCRHRDIKRDKQEGGHLQSVVFAVDVEDWQHDQVGEDEGEHAAEADAAVPQYGGERDVADRADEGDDGNQRADK